MRLLSCLHPKTVKNPYTGDKIQARCGKCEACLNARAANWVQRLNQETQSHKYTYFVTLQYDEQHVPQMLRLTPDDAFDMPSYIDSSTGVVISLQDKCIKKRTRKDYDYCYQTKVLNVHNNTDFPKFIKLLRYYANKLCSNERLYCGLRYYAIAEYGETTFRPHYHCLFFFDSTLLAQNFEKLLSKTWKYGTIYDPHPVTVGSASSYVASYVNSFANLPSIYLHREIRQRTYFSKFPAIGTLNISPQEVQEIFNKATPKQRIFDAARNVFCDVPLWRVFQNRLFPRIQRFSSLSHADRIILYRLAERPAISFSDSKRAAEWLEYYFVRRRNVKGFLNDYFRLISSCPYKHTYGNKAASSGRFTFDSLVRFVRTIKRVAYQSASWGMTIEDYVTKIEEFYDNSEKSNMKEYFILQNEYFENHPPKDYLKLNQDFVKQVNGKKLCDLSESQKCYLDFYGLLPQNDDDEVDLSFTDTFEYQSLLKTHKKIYWDNTKTKTKNDYLAKHSTKFYNIINFLNNENYE